MKKDFATIKEFMVISNEGKQYYFRKHGNIFVVIDFENHYENWIFEETAKDIYYNNKVINAD